jgi:RNA polymerase sigma-70 factor, ECF subfamily
MTTQDDLARWLARVALHDRAAFEKLYNATCAHLLGIAFRISNQRDRAEEVLQESFMNVWHHAGAFDASIASPMTWLINIVRNKAIDLQRSRKTERATTDTLGDEALAVLADDAQQPQQLLESSLLRQHLDDCMATLTATQRQALALAYYRGMTYTEIAVALDAPVSTVKSWVRRGLDRLRSCFAAADVTRA